MRLAGSPVSAFVAVNGSPATITIETCEDPGDWTMAIGGTGSFLGASPGWGPGTGQCGELCLWVAPVLGGCSPCWADSLANSGPAQYGGAADP